MKTTLLKKLIVLALLLPSFSWALDGVSITGGSSLDNHSKGVDFLQVEVRDSFDGRWLESETGSVRAHWDASVTRWNPQSHENWVGAVGVAARYQFSRHDNWAPYLEYGLGGALISHLRVTNNRRFSTHFQFVNRLEMGLRYGQDLENELGLALWHYSNAYIKEPNPGVDFVTLRYTRHF